MALPLLAMMAAGAALGAMKNKREQEVESSDRKLASETARYSPWTKMQPGSIRRAGSQMGSVFGGALSGAGGAQGMGGIFGGGEEGPPPAFARANKFGSYGTPWDGM